MKRKTAPPKKETDDSRLKTGDEAEVLIERLDEEGYGVARAEGRTILVAGTLPGERVVAQVTHAGRRVSFAAAKRIVKRSPARLATPLCRHRRLCEGCPLGIMEYGAQLSWKRDFTAGELACYSSLSGVTVHDTLPSPKQLGYRNSAKLVIAGKFAEPVIGMYRRNSHDVVEIGDCPLHHPLVNKVVEAVRTGIRKGKVPIYSPRTERGLLRYLVVRVSEANDRAMVVFVTAERSYNEIHHLAKHLQAAVPEVAVVAQNVNASTGNVILGPKDHFITKQQTLEERLGDVRFTLSPRSFFQVNGGGARLIYEQARQWSGLTGKETVIDLYCGIGGLSLFLAPKAQRVIGIESVEAAVADAERNARLNGRGNCEFIAGDAARLMEELRDEETKADLIILNPPRKGCDERVLAAAAQMKPQRMIYVSCSPVSLARDLDILAKLGYRTKEVQPVDMFPQTPHVENVALLERH